MDEDRKLEIIIPSFALFAIVLALHFTGAIPFDSFFRNSTVNTNDDFTVFALVTNFLYGFIPQTFQLFGVSAISTVILIRGFNPLIFGLIVAFGMLIGHFIIYYVFRFGFHHNKKGLGGLASATHILHKYHFVAFLFVPWISIGGDALMIIAGHQRINPFKMAPILFISDLASAYWWIFVALGQLEIGNSIG